jgi:hypothetical protein
MLPMLIAALPRVVIGEAGELVAELAAASTRVEKFSGDSMRRTTSSARRVLRLKRRSARSRDSGR